MKKKRKSPQIVIGIFAVLLLLSCLSIKDPKEDKKADQVNTSHKVKVTQTTKPVQKRWRGVTSFRGESIKDTKTFSISSDDWRIRWYTNPGKYGDMNFIVTIMNSDGTIAGSAANIIGKGNDESYMRGAGDYYLSINTAQKYNIYIEEYK